MNPDLAAIRLKGAGLRRDTAPVGLCVGGALLPCGCQAGS